MGSSARRRALKKSRRAAGQPPVRQQLPERQDVTVIPATAAASGAVAAQKNEG